MNKLITLAFSPCPNDTFIFDALVHQKIDTEGLKFDYHIADVEELNKEAFHTTYDVSKMSFNAFLNVLSSYVSLTYGAAFCDNFGPVVVAQKGLEKKASDAIVAVPGLYTTAASLYQMFFPFKKLYPVHFTKVEEVLNKDLADIGVLIHEQVFSYSEKRLEAIANLGQLWYAQTQLPVPLGCIAVRRSMAPELKMKINRLLGKSIRYAMKNPKSANDFVLLHADNTQPLIVEKHIKTYVNAYSLNFNENAIKAVKTLMSKMPDSSSLEKLSIIV